MRSPTTTTMANATEAEHSPGRARTLGTRLGWLLLLWLGGVGTVFIAASLMRWLMRFGGLVG